MSRSGYSEDGDNWSLIRWRGAVNSALRGKRGQSLLQDLAEAMDAMPEKRLIADELEHNGEVCSLGAVGKARGLHMEHLDPENSAMIANSFGIAEALAREIVYENDEGAFYDETPEQRWKRMRRWVDKQLDKEPS